MRKQPKKIVLGMLAVATAFLMTGCVTVNFSGGRYNTMQGKGAMVEDSFTAEPYTEVEIDIDAEVIYTADASDLVKVEMQKNLLDTLEVSVKNGRLKITSPYQFSYVYENRPKVYIATPELKAFIGGGEIEFTQADKIKTTDFSLAVAGSANVDLKLACTTVRVEISGDGDVTLQGTATDTSFSIHGMGDIDATKLSAKNATTTISGDGVISVNASETLQVNISGSGTINYLGNPRISQKINGDGEIIAI